MPIIASKYKAPKWLPNGHSETLYPFFFRRVANLPYERERIETPDDDFLDLDWLRSGHRHRHRQLVIISHGLEGSSDSPYIKGMSKAFGANGWDVLAWNYRSCSGEPNRQAHSYHSGATHDLSLVIQHAIKKNKYDKIGLVGFSLGGNLTLKYLGEQNTYLPNIIERAVVFSTPTNLGAASKHLSTGFNKVYTDNFLVSLTKKVKIKAKLMPEKFDLSLLKKIKTLSDFDEFFTAPLHGFKSANDYYTQCSSAQFIPLIKIPTLIVNALSDPFLPNECYPFDLTRHHPNVYFEASKRGGHVGFWSKNAAKMYWSEQRALAFMHSGSW